MARIPEADIERLKDEVSVERLVEAAGIELKKSGKNRLGACPFHDDAEPSLVVTPSKNLWHCFSCQIGGGPIDWVMKFKGVSFRHAVEMLKADPSSAVQGEAVKRSRSRVLPAPVAFDADDQTLLDQTIGYYHETLKNSPEALAYLQARGLSHPEMIDTFKLGYANRTLGLRLPEKTTAAGADIRARLQKIGLYRESGHEHFNGSLIVPIRDAGGHAVEVYGRKIRDDLRTGTPKHLYLPGPHRGVFNHAVLGAAKEIILCEALIDALTFWCAGYRNVTSCYGVEGFTDDMLEAFQAKGVKRVLIAFDRDDAGDRAAEKLAQRLTECGIDCYRVLFPKGMDANEYAQKMQPADRALGLLLRKAQWMGQGKAPAREAAEEIVQLVPVAPALPLAVEPVEPPAAVDLPEPSEASPQPAAPETDTPIEQNEHELVIEYGERRYRIRGWKKPLNPESLKVNLLVSRGERFHVDTLDLYSAKARAAFMKLAGIELGESEDVIKHDLGRVLLKLEELQAEQLKAALEKEEKSPALSDTEQAEALGFLKSPDLMQRILADFDAIGVVGEETNKLVGYLAAVSRQLDKPLAVIIQSSSAAGKSSLMDAVLSLVPDEAQVRYSAMTGQSLFYMGQTNLKHKILAIAEEEGASSAAYALKLLQSDGQVTIASTGKDPNTGLLVTHEYRVEGPVMLFLTTTAIDIDEELMNRCLVLSVNESREQTRAIHAIQRRRQTLEGLLADAERDDVMALHRNAQRLLQPLAVVNPFADRLSFLDDKTRTRRDHVKYLSLIRAIAFLHQYQREVKAIKHKGRWLRYIETTEADIAMANRLAHEVLGRTLDELPPQTRRLLTMLHEWVEAQCRQQQIRKSELRFTRRAVRELTGWGDTQCRVHLERLAQMEYLLVHGGRRGQVFEYELLYSGEGESGGRFLMGLQDIAPDMPTTQSSRGSKGKFAGASRGQRGPDAGPSRQEETSRKARQDAALPLAAEPDAQNAPLPDAGELRSYLPALAVAC